MKSVSFPYGKKRLSYDFRNEELVDILHPSIGRYCPEKEPEQLVEQALEHPIGSQRLEELAEGKKKIVIIISDHTRPVPSRVILPPMLRRIRTVNPHAQITLLVATGCHRDTTQAELADKLGSEIAARERIVIHNCDRREQLTNIGVLPSGGECEINSIAMEADLLLAEGFIEPHFFAGFSGGRKSVLPGIAGRTTVLSNHCSEFIDHPNARTGILEGNPIHADMLWAARRAKLAFIVNVVLNEEKRVIHAVAGDMEQAHLEGVRFLKDLCSAEAVEADVAVTTNGGYPLDQNMYQAVKGMTAAESTVRQGGVIIMLAQSGDGVGGEHFYRQLAQEPDLHKTMALFRSRGRTETVPDQWQTQILLRILIHAKVIYVSDMEDSVVSQMHMIPAHSIGEALGKARLILGKEQLRIAAIPDGVSVIVKKGLR